MILTFSSFSCACFLNCSKLSFAAVFNEGDGALLTAAAFASDDQLLEFFTVPAPTLFGVPGLLLDSSSAEKPTSRRNSNTVAIKFA